jgi:hypothetical protein
MLRAPLVAFSVAAVTASALAQSTAVSVCDDFIRKFEICINTKMPAAERATFQAGLDRWRQIVADFASGARIYSDLYKDNPRAMAEWKEKVENQLGNFCRSQADFERLRSRDYGCVF